MDNWQSIKTAPKDGTVIRLRNAIMKNSGWSVRGHWGEFRSDVTGKIYTDWCTDYTDDGDFKVTPSGRLICPTEWQPDAPAKCRSCDGKGVVCDWVGLEMKPVAAECGCCNGTGATP